MHNPSPEKTTGSSAEGTAGAAGDPGKVRHRPEPEEGPLRILFEDASILVLDKPAGTVVHPTYKHAGGTLLNAVLWYLRDRDGTQPGILTRLDKDTSGVVVMALTAPLHAAMQRDMIAGRMHKAYLAIVAGTPDPPDGAITLALGRSPEDRRVVVARPDGAACETRYETLARADTPGGAPRAMLRCEPVTGRTHQIRVHLAASGWPIVGDRVYGDADADMPRQALHAWRVTMRHPVTAATLRIDAPIPDDMRRIMPPGWTSS